MAAPALLQRNSSDWTSEDDDESPPAALGVRYLPQKQLGRGSYGTVYKATDAENGETVALKCIQGVFYSNTDTKRTLREISLLRQCDHPNIISIQNLLQPFNPESFGNLWVVFEYLPWDLKRVIENSKSIPDWRLLHVQSIIYQMLCGLLYLHSANIVHRDIKPANILVNRKGQLKIIDFGLARNIKSGEPSVPVAAPPPVDSFPPTPPKAPKRPALNRGLTTHVVTRWYRAPELILQRDDYDGGIDVWAVGCIAAELLQTIEGRGRPRPIFPGGPTAESRGDSYRESKHGPEGSDDVLADVQGELRDPKSQLNKIFNRIGTPSDEDLQSLGESVRKSLSDIPAMPRRDWKDILPTAPSQAFELLNSMLQFDPAKRISVTEALAHPFLKPMRDARKELLYPGTPPTSPFELTRLSRKEMRHLILREIATYGASTPSVPEPSSEGGASGGALPSPVVEE